MAKLPRSPAGVAVHPWLNRPDTKFNARGVYKVKLAFDSSDPAAQEFKASLEKLRDDKLAEWKADPANKKYLKRLSVNDVCAEELDDEGEPTGRWLFNFSTYASYKDKKTGQVVQRKPPTLFDSRRNVVTVNVFGGSTLKVAYSPSFWFSAKDTEVGLKTYLVAVQIIELVSGSGASFFDDEDGYVAEASAAPDTAPAGEDSGEDSGEEAIEDDDEF